jgi:hypothetical protein
MSRSPEKYNIELANRQIQVNEWAYNNKMDTLFVFQLIFITLMMVTIMLVLKGQGFLENSFVWYSIGVLAVINVMIIINRSMYTNNKRDKQSWSKKHFDGDNTQGSPLSRGDASYQAYIDSVRSEYGASADSPSCRCPKPAANC